MRKSLWSAEQTPEEEAHLIPLTVCAQSLLFLLPGMSAAVLLRCWRKPRLANYSFVLWSSLAFAFEALDLQTYGAFGRHLRQIARFAFLPNGAQVSGGSAHWALPVAVRVLALSVLGSLLATLAARRALSPLTQRSTPFFRRSLTALALPVLGFGKRPSGLVRGRLLSSSRSARAPVQATRLVASTLTVLERRLQGSELGSARRWLARRLRTGVSATVLPATHDRRCRAGA